MDILDALEDAEIAFKQFEFAIRMLSYCELGHIKPSEFDTDHLIILHEGNFHFRSGNFSTPDDLIRAASVAVLQAFSLSVLVLDKAFEIACIMPDPEAADNFVRLRTLVYMLRCAQAHGPADPRWEARGKYARTLRIDLDDVAVSLDLAALNGQQFLVDQIGGYYNWYCICRSAMVRLKTH